MRILFITPSYFPIIGGSERLTHIIAAKLREVGIKTDILTFNMDEKWRPIWKAKTIKDGTFTIFKIPALNPLPNLPNPLSNLLSVNVIPSLSYIKMLRNYDILHFVGEADLSLPIFSYFVKKPKVFHCVGIFEHGGIYKYLMFERPFLKKVFMKYFPILAGAYIVYSNKEKKLLSCLGVPSEKILTLPLGVDTKTFRPNTARRIDNLVLFVGRIDRIKGLHILLYALSHLEIPIQLAIIGPRWDKEYAKEIERMIYAINEKGIHKIKMLGEVDHSDLVSWYQKASVVVCPYIYETYSTVTLEALACGTPVVSTGAHITGQEPDGILTTPKTAEKIAAAIRKLLEDRELREKYGREGRKCVRKNFSWDSIVKKLIEIYMNLLANQENFM